jgi:hypothetical protein
VGEAATQHHAPAVRRHHRAPQAASCRHCLRYACTMCRSIRTLRGADPPATHDDVRAAALQFVRKLSGYRVPSAANRAAFTAAVDEVALAAERLLEGLVTREHVGDVRS